MDAQKKRIAYWDNVKWFMILLVVVGHFALQYFEESLFSACLHLFLYAFHMPVFFFVSGVFFDRKKAKTSFVYYLAGGLLLKLAFALCDILLGEKVSFYLLYEGDIPWFMFALAYHYALMYFFGAGNRKYMLVISILLACVAGYENLGNYLTLSRTIAFFPFFILGTMFTKPAREKAAAVIGKHRGVFCTLAVAVLVIWAGLCVFQIETVAVCLPLFKGKSPYPDEVASYGILARLGCYLVSALTGAAVLVLCPRKRLKGISYMGTKTVNVYFWHWIVYMLVSGYIGFDSLFYAGALGQTIYYVIAIVLCVVLSSVKVFDWPLRQIKAAIRFDSPETEKAPDAAPRENAERKDEQKGRDGTP